MQLRQDEAHSETPTESLRQRLKMANPDAATRYKAQDLFEKTSRRRNAARAPTRRAEMWGPFQQKRPTFVAAAATYGSLPEHSIPEVAVIGRSNVGKSSLLNALTGSTALARVSDKPGRTQELIFFHVGRGPDSFHLVDMPGYGFALASERRVAAWAQLSAAYLQKRQTLKLVLVLIDSRVGLKQSDLDMFAFLEHSTKLRYLPVLTKVDLAGTPQRIAQMASVVQESLKGTSRRQVAPAHLVSSRHNAGIDDLQKRIFAAASGAADDAFLPQQLARGGPGQRGGLGGRGAPRGASGRGAPRGASGRGAPWGPSGRGAPVRGAGMAARGGRAGRGRVRR